MKAKKQEKGFSTSIHKINLDENVVQKQVERLKGAALKVKRAQGPLHIMSQSLVTRRFQDIDLTLQKVLDELFGKEEDLNSQGVLSDFDYDSYSYAVMLSYIKYTKQNKIFTSRENEFYKGKRWSKIERKQHFYQIFEAVKNELGEDSAPATYFIKVFSGKKQYLKIDSKRISEFDIDHSAEQKIINERLIKNGREEISVIELFLPIIEDQEDFNKLKIFLEMVNSLKCSDSDSQIYFSEKSIKDIIKEVVLEFEEDYSSYLSYHPLKSYIDILCEELKQYQIYLSTKAALGIILSYQFYDIPYSMHFFLPKKTSCSKVQNEGVKKNSCSLAFSTPTGRIFDDYSIQAWSTFITTLYGYSEIKCEIWKKFKPEIEFEWEIFYRKYLPKYSLLAEGVQNIFRSICDRYNIKGEISVRVKNFESFFNKIVNRANGSDKDFPSRKILEEKYGPSDSWDDILYKVYRQKYINAYRDRVCSSNNEDYLYILKELKDVVGIRIVCAYKKDINKLKELLDGLDNNDDKRMQESLGLNLIDKKDPYVKQTEASISSGEVDDHYYYTSTHYTFTLSKDRTRLVEFSNLQDYKFELQIRTILSQGISEVSHDMYYKTGLPDNLDEKLRSEMRRLKIPKHSRSLDKIDDDFSELRDVFQKIQEEIPSLDS